MNKTKKILIKLFPATHTALKRNADNLGMTMDDVIGAALETFEKRSDDDKQKSFAVWSACRSFMQAMQEKK